jgi:hypothetical protein
VNGEQANESINPYVDEERRMKQSFAAILIVSGHSSSRHRRTTRDLDRRRADEADDVPPAMMLPAIRDETTFSYHREIPDQVMLLTGRNIHHVVHHLSCDPLRRLALLCESRKECDVALGLKAS